MKCLLRNAEQTSRNQMETRLLFIEVCCKPPLKVSSHFRNSQLFKLMEDYYGIIELMSCSHLTTPQLKNDRPILFLTIRDFDGSETLYSPIKNNSCNIEAMFSLSFAFSERFDKTYLTRYSQQQFLILLSNDFLMPRNLLVSC